MPPKEDFKVAFTFGVLQTRFAEMLSPDETQDGQGDGQQPKYMFTTLGRALVHAGIERGWQSSIVKLGLREAVKTPRPDLVVNLISEPIAQRGALDELAAFAAIYPMPIINPAQAIGATARHALSDTVCGFDRVQVPKTTIFNLGQVDIEDHVTKHGHSWPLLLRPIGSHGGVGLIKIERGDPLPDGPNGPFWYLTDFVDYRAQDGLYRKYRAVWTGQRIFRRHMIVSDGWNIDGNSRAYMVGKTDLIDEERAFIQSEVDELDGLLESLFRQTGLDFGVIDFTRREDDSLVIFELNATLQIARSIPADKIERWGHLEHNNDLILDSMVSAFEKKHESFQV